MDSCLRRREWWERREGVKGDLRLSGAWALLVEAEVRGGKIDLARGR